MEIRGSGRFQKGIKLLSKEPKLVGIKMQSSAQGPFAENRGFTHARFGLGTAVEQL